MNRSMLPALLVILIGLALGMAIGFTYLIGAATNPDNPIQIELHYPTPLPSATPAPTSRAASQGPELLMFWGATSGVINTTGLLYRQDTLPLTDFALGMDHVWPSGGSVPYLYTYPAVLSNPN